MAGANLLLQGRPIAIEPMSNRLAKFLQLEEAQQGNALRASLLAGRERAAVDQNRLRAIYAGGQTGEALEAELLKQGFAKESGDLGKQRRDNAKTDADTANTRSQNAERELKMALDRLNFGNQTGAALLSSRTPLTRETVARALLPGINSKVFDVQFAQDFLGSLPDDDAGIRTALQRGIESGMTIKDRLEQEWRATQTQTTRRGQDMTRDTAVRGQDVAAQTARRGQDMTAETARLPQFVPVEGVGLFVGDRKTGTATEVKGPGDTSLRKPTPAEQAAAARSTKARDVLDILNEADALIPQATGSYTGAGVDLAARGAGASNTGSRAIAQLKVLQAQLMLAQPRMEGPQSDRDVQLYREAAASLGDPTVPRAEKQDAANMIRRLNEKYAGMTPGSSKPAPQKPAATAQAPANDGVIDFNSLSQ